MFADPSGGFGHPWARYIASPDHAGVEVRGDAALSKLDGVILPRMRIGARNIWTALLPPRPLQMWTRQSRISKPIARSPTECVMCEDMTVRDKFFERIDSAILMHNASTQFADGGEFGMGAEIGIATGKMHARGLLGPRSLPRLNIWSKETELPAPKG